MISYSKTKLTLLILVCSIQQLDAMPVSTQTQAPQTATPTSQLLGTLTYNANGQLSAQGDSAGKQTHYLYDSNGQLTLTQDRAGHDLHQQYSDTGQLEVAWVDTNASPTETTPGQDATNILTLTYRPGDNRNISASLQDTHSLATPPSSNLSYTLSGQINSKQFPSGKTQQYAYTRQGQIKTFTNIAGQQTQYTYTPMQELASVTIQNTDNQPLENVQYQYNPFGQLTQAQRSNHITSNWTYNDYNGVASLISQQNDKTLQNIQYQYDISGNLQHKTLADKTQYTYGYNDLNELASFSCTGGNSCPTYTNKATQQTTAIQSRSYTYTLNRGIKSVTTNGATPVTYTYQVNQNYPDRLASVSDGTQPVVYDANGNMTTDSDGDHITYNALNQMTSIQLHSSGTTEKFAYNTNGKLAQETVGSASPTQIYYALGQHPTISAETQDNTTATYALGLKRVAQFYADSTAQTNTPQEQDYLRDCQLLT